MGQESEHFIDTHQAAAHLGMAAKTLYKKARLGQVPCHRLPGNRKGPMRFRITELDAFMGNGGALRRP